MVGLGTLFHIKFFVEGFIITISIIILHVFIYFYPTVNPIPMNLMIAFISPAIRLISLLIEHIPLSTAFNMVAPDAMFYVAFGIINYWIYFRRKQKDLSYFALSAILCDTLSNIVELSFRISMSNINLEILRTLIIVAVSRALIAVVFILVFKNYKRFLDREAHDVRYAQLMLMSSHFKSEIYYLKKNMNQIEETMKKAYRAYKMTESFPSSPAFQSLSLEIAKDIHEIKKDYIHVIKGLEGFMSDELRDDQISLKDIFKILEINTYETLKSDNSGIELKFVCYEDLYIHDHYYLMSILKNLIHNAVDALADVKNPTIRLSAYQFTGKDALVLTVEDNGKGISEDERPYIFDPGYSTKFNTTTGDIFRGLGLSIVRHLVEEKFRGSIVLESNPYKSTKMILQIPIAGLRGEFQ
jgi:two-component system sensor histidine kinase YcbA